jgi:hypothetical protein
MEQIPVGRANLASGRSRLDDLKEENMSNADIVRAWKDPEYRLTLGLSRVRRDPNAESL